MKMLIFPLKKEWYEKIKSGEKTVEYREVKPYWDRRIQKEVQKFGSLLFLREHGDWIEFNNIPLECKLREGYGSNYMSANIARIEIINGLDTDLEIDKPVYAIHLAAVKEA